MIAIITRTLPATDRRGCRIVATAPSHPGTRLVVGYNYAAHNHDNHVDAAAAYVARHLAQCSVEHAASAQSGTNSYTHIYG